MRNPYRYLGRWLARYLNGQARGPYPHPPADLEVLQRMLRPADVILVEGRQRISGAIKYLTQSTWSHAALFVGDTGGSDAEGRRCTLLESDTELGVHTFPLQGLEGYHLRMCRPVGLSEEDAARVVAYALHRVGNRYDLRNVFDLLRYLLPTPPVPTPWRRRMLALGSGDPTRAICSTLIAQAFQSVGFPVLPTITRETADDPACRECAREHYHIRHYSLFVPRDFDVSPYFQIIKPALFQGDYHGLPWANEKNCHHAKRGLRPVKQYLPITRSTLPAMRYPHHFRSLPATLKGSVRVVLDPSHLKRTLLIAFVVGSWLNLFNHVDELLHGMLSAQLAAKLVLNYLMPFVVSNVDLLAHKKR